MAFLDSLPEEYSGLDANVIAKKFWARRGEKGDGVIFLNGEKKKKNSKKKNL